MNVESWVTFPIYILTDSKLNLIKNRSSYFKTVMSSPPPPPSSLPFSGGSQSNRRSFFNRRFHNSSSFSLASVNTILPQYTAVDGIGPESPPLSDERSHGSESISRVEPHPKSHNCSSPLGGAAMERFEYAFPIRPNNSWCTLRLYTENLLSGNPQVTTHQSHHKPKTPKFWGGQIIAGLLELELDRPQTIHCISLTVCCAFTSESPSLTCPVFPNSSEEKSLLGLLKVALTTFSITMLYFGINRQAILMPYHQLQM